MKHFVENFFIKCKIKAYIYIYPNSYKTIKLMKSYETGYYMT